MPADIFFDKIAAKIQKLKTAVFSDFSESIVKFPTSIVQVINATEDGEIWFSLPRPYPDISGLEKTFPVELHFYNKKLNYYINIQGVAELVSNTNVMPDNIIRRFIYLAHGQLLLCVKMGRMEYFEKRKNRNLHLFDPIADLLRWLIYNKDPYLS